MVCLAIGTMAEQTFVEIVCGKCGSDNVSRDAWGDWDVAAQQWVLRTVFDYAYCHRCDCETRLIERELSEPPPSNVRVGWAQDAAEIARLEQHEEKRDPGSGPG